MFFLKTSIIISSFLIFCSAGKATSTEEVKAINQKSIVLVPELGDTSFHVTGNDSGYKSASMIGVAAKFSTSMNRLNWSTGIQYLQTGYKLKQDFGIFSFPLADISMDYLAVPVKSEFLVSDPTKNGFKFFLNAGLTPMYLLSAKFKNLVDSSEKEKGVRNDMNGLDILASLGLGGRYDTEIGAFDLTFEYNKGLMKIKKDENIKSEGFIARIAYNYAL